MELRAVPTSLKEVQSLRLLYLQEINAQIRYNACHERGWTDSYLLMVDDVVVGYGSIMGQQIKGRDTVFEFYVLPPFRSQARGLFRELVLASKAPFIECQSNDPILPALLYAFAQNIRSPVILFKDNVVTSLCPPGAVFRIKREEDTMFDHKQEPEGDFVLVWDGEIVGSGGFLRHYNLPFADLYMEVREEYRRKGFGSFIIQEVKRECYLAGRVPAARCNMENAASKATLLKAGLAIAGYMLMGDVKKEIILPPASGVN
jgi:GNAT superfamily N-acetyltransferase